MNDVDQEPQNPARVFEDLRLEVRAATAAELRLPRLAKRSTAIYLKIIDKLYF